MRASICNFRRLGGSVRRRRMVARFGGRCFGSGIRMAIRNEQAATAKRRHRESDSGPSSGGRGGRVQERSEEHTSELQSLMRISYAVFCLKKKKHITTNRNKEQR